MNIQESFYKTLLDNVYDGVYFVDTLRKIIYWNHGAERITGYMASRVLGSLCSDNILVHVDASGKQLCKEDCPLTDTLKDGKMHTADIFLHHSDGHRVPVNVTVSPILDSTGAIVGAVELFRETSAIIIDPQELEELKNAAFLDPLTGLANRRFMEMKLRASFEELLRHGISFGVLYADIDHFKSINDTYGHLIGDAVLKMVGKTFESNVRKSDLACRWGGEEFVLTLTYVNDERLQSLAEKLRMLVERSFLDTDAGRVKVTITMGGAVARTDDTIESLIGKTDQLLYKGKIEGRNRVMF